MRYLIATVVFLLFLVLLAWVNGPMCPSEDSCRADYYDGQWHIIQQVP